MKSILSPNQKINLFSKREEQILELLKKNKFIEVGLVIEKTQMMRGHFYEIINSLELQGIVQKIKLKKYYFSLNKEGLKKYQEKISQKINKTFDDLINSNPKDNFNEVNKKGRLENEKKTSESNEEFILKEVKKLNPFIYKKILKNLSKRKKRVENRK